MEFGATDGRRIRQLPCHLGIGYWNSRRPWIWQIDRLATFRGEADGSDYLCGFGSHSADDWPAIVCYSCVSSNSCGSTRRAAK